MSAADVGSAAERTAFAPRGTSIWVFCCGVLLIGCGARQSPPPTSAARTMGATPTRTDVVDAMAPITHPIASCGDGSGRGEVDLQFAITSDGSIADVQVIAGQLSNGTPIAGTSVEACVLRAARGTHFPPFGNDVFRFTFPFRL